MFILLVCRHCSSAARPASDSEAASGRGRRSPHRATRLEIQMVDDIGQFKSRGVSRENRVRQKRAAFSFFLCRCQSLVEVRRGNCSRSRQSHNGFHDSMEARGAARRQAPRHRQKRRGRRRRGRGSSAGRGQLFFRGKGASIGPAWAGVGGRTGEPRLSSGVRRNARGIVWPFSKVSRQLPPQLPTGVPRATPQERNWVGGTLTPQLRASRGALRWLYQGQ